ncbi:MAG: four helix bundle protein [Bdellovibrionales bacterium]|nr:four helix bundle protein [Bdellovibrionales bacterium]
MLSNFRTYQLAKVLHAGCQGLRMSEPYRDQLDRAVLSVVLNLAEGSGKLTRPERRRFYGIALGSLREVQAILELRNEQAQSATADQLGAMIYKLTQNPGP